MKKILFSSASAILAVVGFSAFKTAKTSTTYYWFTAPSSTQLYNLTTRPQVAEIDYYGDGIAPSDVCSSGSLHYCVIGYTANQINFVSGVPNSFKKTVGGVKITAPRETSEFKP